MHHQMAEMCSIGVDDVRVCATIGDFFFLFKREKSALETLVKCTQRLSAQKKNRNKKVNKIKINKNILWHKQKKQTKKTKQTTHQSIEKLTDLVKLTDCCVQVCVPARKRALEAQDSEQASAPPLLMQDSWACGTGFPLGRHFTTSEE